PLNRGIGRSLAGKRSTSSVMPWRRSPTPDVQGWTLGRSQHGADLEKLLWESLTTARHGLWGSF
ncbi:MAG: hypothetical protein WBC80_23355, partial [Isosphaeraceae bacterium]